MNRSNTWSLPDYRGRRVAITGAAGQLGSVLSDQFRKSGATVIRLGRSRSPLVDIAVDIADHAAVVSAARESNPEWIVHAAAYTDVDGCELNPRLAEAINAQGAANVAAAAREVGAHLISVSTDYVFSGTTQLPYAEDDKPQPLSAYGRSKLHGEQAVLGTDSAFAVVRTAWLYGGNGKHFPRTVVNAIKTRGEISIVGDEFGSPTYVDDLAEGLVRLAQFQGGGIYHLTNEGIASRFEFARSVAEHTGFDPESVLETTRQEFLTRFPLPAARPQFSALANLRAATIGIALRPWQEAVAEYGPRLAADMGIEHSPDVVANSGKVDS